MGKVRGQLVTNRVSNSEQYPFGWNSKRYRRFAEMKKEEDMMAPTYAEKRIMGKSKQSEIEVTSE